MWNTLRPCKVYRRVNGLLHEWITDGYGRLYGIVEFEDGRVECVENNHIQLLGNPFDAFSFEEK